MQKKQEPDFSGSLSEFYGLFHIGREDNALLFPSGQGKVVGVALLVVLAVQLRQQSLHRFGMALGDEHRLSNFHVIGDAAVVIHP